MKRRRRGEHAFNRDHDADAEEHGKEGVDDDILDAFAPVFVPVDGIIGIIEDAVPGAEEEPAKTRDGGAIGVHNALVTRK